MQQAVSKSLLTVPEDVYHLLSRDSTGVAGVDSTVGTDILFHVNKAIESTHKPREIGKLWASDIGKECDLFTNLSFHNEEEKEKLAGHVHYKFLYGNVIEELTLHLVKEAGHTVTDQQERIEVEVSKGWKVSGKIDGLIDGVLMDVKSASTFGFNRYAKEGVTQANDTFGYRYQLAFYYYYGPAHWAKHPPKFLFVDKGLGHIAVVDCELPTMDELQAKMAQKIQAITAATPPGRLSPVPEGAKGNMKLGLTCSYCDFKKKCWPDLRTFIYSRGPTFLTTVKSLPNVYEATNDG
jgi:hypothetical protein